MSTRLQQFTSEHTIIDSCVEQTPIGVWVWVLYSSDGTIYRNPIAFDTKEDAQLSLDEAQASKALDDLQKHMDR